MAYKISDIPTHNTAPGDTAKIESENPTGPQSQWSTLAEALPSTTVVKELMLPLHAYLGGL